MSIPEFPLRVNDAWRVGRLAPAAKQADFQSAARAVQLSQLAALIGIVTAPIWLWSLFFSHDYHIAADYLVVLIVALVGIGFVIFASRGDAALRNVMLSSLLLKFASGSIYIYVVYRVYDAAADLPTYHWNGYLMATDLALTGRWPVFGIGTDFVKFSVAMLYSVFGPSLPGATAVYLSIAFLGQYLLYRAFCIAYPRGDKYSAALFMFLLPSILYWPSTLGKDCQSMLAVGMVSYGLASASRKVGLFGYVNLVLGLAVIALVRPHMAGILAITCAFPYILDKNRTGLWGGLLKLAVAPFLIAVCLYFVQQGAEFVDAGGVGAHTLNTVARNNASGGSAFNVNASIPMRVATAPFLMFRPFPWEAHNLQSFAASAEGLFLLWFVWKHRANCRAAIRRARSDAFAAYAIGYSIVFSVLFAGAMTNFGLLARQRVMMVPVALMLFLPVDPSQIQSARRLSRASLFAQWGSRAHGRVRSMSVR